MAKINEKNKPYGLKLLDSLLSPSSKHERFAIDLALKSKDLGGFVPAFFYRHPFYSVKMREGITLFGNYSIKMAYKSWAKDDRERFEYILSRAEYHNGVLSSRFKTRDIIEKFNLDFQVFFEGFCDLRIKIGDGIRHKSFPIFDGFYSDDRNSGYVEMIFSKDMEKIFSSDFMVNPLRLTTIENRLGKFPEKVERNYRTLLRFVCTINTEPGKLSIPLESSRLEGFGFEYDQWTINAMQKGLFSNTIHKDECLVVPLVSIGIGFTPNVKTFSYRQGYIAPEAPTIYVDKYDNKKVIAELKKNLKISTPDHEFDQDDSGEYIVYSTLSLSDKILNIARTKGFSIDESRELFSIFKTKYAEKEYQHKTTSLGRVWGTFLKNQIKFEEEKRSTPNSGDPLNIVYDSEMQEKTEIYKINAVNAATMYEDFREHYVSIGTPRKNWVVAWGMWLKRDKIWKEEKAQKSSGEGSTWQVKTQLENKFYISKLISEGIKKMLAAQGITPYDVIKGVYIVEEVEFATVPVPPSGKNTEVIFSFRDSTLQDKAVAEVVKDPKSDKIKDYVEAKVIEGEIHE